jgi:hypothetical protein
VLKVDLQESRIQHSDAMRCRQKAVTISSVYPPLSPGRADSAVWRLGPIPVKSGTDVEISHIHK